MLFLTPGTQNLSHPNGTQGYPRPTGNYPRDQILLVYWYHIIINLVNKIFKIFLYYYEPYI